MTTNRREPTVEQLLDWMREIGTPSWQKTVRDIEYALGEMQEEAELKRSRRRRA
jgi:hypothetical protein